MATLPRPTNNTTKGQAISGTEQYIGNIDTHTQAGDVVQAGV